MVREPAAALRDAQAAKDAGADLVELRIDEVFNGEGDEAGQKLVLKLIADCPLPCIVTCRPIAEGGFYDGDEPSRISLLERLATAFGPGEHPPRYIDVELSTYTRSANIRQKIRLAVNHPEQLRDLSTSLILSSHDFQGRPADLTRRILRMQEEPAANILKIAFLARSIRDNLELFDLLAQRDRPMIALAMGESGLMSRILAPKFGGFLTFASLRREEVTAPGQPTIRDLLDLYRFRAVKPDTAVYGVIGHPVAHSLSPLVHNAGFEAVGHDGVYLPLPVAGGEKGGYENLKATLGELIDHPRLDFRGASVTSPHKENLARLAAEMGWHLDAPSAAVRSANTVTIDRSRVRVTNTDIPALDAVVREALGDPAGRRVAVVGAGGVARAAVYALITAGAYAIVFNRTHKRAVLLAESCHDLGPGAVAAGALEDLPTCGCEAILHCTPQGMTGSDAEDDIAIPMAPFQSRSPAPVIIETVYHPLETPLYKSALAHNLRAIDGVALFTRQAAIQFETWIGTKAPTQLFERLCRESLSARP